MIIELVRYYLSFSFFFFSFLHELDSRCYYYLEFVQNFVRFTNWLLDDNSLVFEDGKRFSMEIGTGPWPTFRRHGRHGILWHWTIHAAAGYMRYKRACWKIKPHNAPLVWCPKKSTFWEKSMLLQRSSITFAAFSTKSRWYLTTSLQDRNIE